MLEITIIAWVGKNLKHPKLEDDVWSKSTAGRTAQTPVPGESYTRIFIQKFLKEFGFGVF